MPRPRTPDVVRELRGETRPSRRRVEPVPLGPIDMRHPPRSLDVEVAKVWRRVVRELQAQGLAWSADVDVVVAYCEAVVLGDMAWRAIKKNKAVVTTGSKGNDVKHPALQVWRDARSLTTRLAGELGLSPRGRANLGETAPGGGRRPEEEDGPSRPSGGPSALLSG